MTDDPINPEHYKGAVECIDCIESMTEGMTDGVAAFLKGNAAKYLYRAGRKGDASTDIRKAIWYLQRYIARIEAQEADL